MAISARCTFESMSPYSCSKFYQVEKKPKESSAAYEERTWRERCNTDSTGQIIIPPMAFKNCLSEAAKYLGMQIPGKGRATYTKHIESGVLVLEGLPLGVSKDEVPGEWLFVPADGRRGGGKRVQKCFPCIYQWTGDVTFHILDPTVTEDVFVEHVREMGNFIGVGRFRPKNNGFYGRFRLVKHVWNAT